MSLWIQQDLVDAIARTNHVDDPDANIFTVPVKRLLRIWIVPGYVGINGQSGLTVSPPGMKSSGGSSPGYAAPEPAPTAPPSGGAPAASFTTLSSASSALGPKGEVVSDFQFSPTGRVSNALYDVKHVWVSAVVDVRQLPAFFDNLSRVNFMTVLLLQMHPVDEYDALQQGFIYGTSDEVQVDMLIETIWFRQWTAPLMPPEVRTVLGIAPATPPPGTSAGPVQ